MIPEKPRRCTWKTLQAKGFVLHLPLRNWYISGLAWSRFVTSSRRSNSHSDEGICMKLVILESPYAGDIEANVEYARACVRDSLSRGEAPIASHLLYTQPGILRDEVAAERQWGIDAGLAWKAVAHGSVVYTDRGITKGMQYGIDAAKAAGRTVEFRSLKAEESAA
jgi:hypothetical protein